MKQFSSIFIIVLTFVSCKNGNDKINEKTALLTSTSWTASSGPGKTKNSTWTFDADGTYTEDHSLKGNTGNVVMKGTWKWISEDEIQFVYKSMSVNGVDNALAENDADAYIMRVTEMNSSEIKGITRFKGDSEDSGFAKEVHYTATML